MDFKKVADHLRNATTPLAVSKVVIISDQGDFTGNGKLQRNSDALELDVTLSGVESCRGLICGRPDAILRAPFKGTS